MQPIFRNKASFNITIIVCIFFLKGFADITIAQDTIQRNCIYTITIQSPNTISNVNELGLIRAVFKHESGMEYDVSGYWNGGNDFKIKFSPDQNGKWSFITYSNNLYLKDSVKSGKFHVIDYTGTNPFQLNGFPVVAKSKRYLAHKNGKPFLLLAETAWEVNKNSTLSELKYFLDLRKKQNFNGIMLVLNSHINLPLTGVKNQYGENAFLDTNFHIPNPRFYDYVDTVINTINSCGMIAIIVPVWSNHTIFYDEYNYHKKLMDMQGILNLTNYASARYCGNNVIWIAATDESYNTLERKNYVRSVAKLIKTNTANRHLVTAHSHGWTSTLDFFDSTDTWLDFNSFQSSHTINSDRTFVVPHLAFSSSPTKPIIDLEGCYEDIFNNLIITNNSLRIDSRSVVAARYQAFLSGATMGITYGGNGIWQWSEDPNGFFNPRFSLKYAMNFKGAEQCGKLITMMNKIDWYNLQPAQQLLGEHNAKFNIPISKSKNFIVAYLPVNTTKLNIRYVEFSNKVKIILFDPRNGKTYNTNLYSVSDTSGELVINRSDTNEAVLIGYDPDFTTLPFLENDMFISNDSLVWLNFNNKINSSTLTIKTRFKSNAKLQIFNFLGKSVISLEQLLNEGVNIMPYQLNQKGIYFYKLKLNDSIFFSGKILIN